MRTSAGTGAEHSKARPSGPKRSELHQVKAKQSNKLRIFAKQSKANFAGGEEDNEVCEDELLQECIAESITPS